MESNDSPEIPNRKETSDIPGLPSGVVVGEVVVVVVAVVVVVIVVAVLPLLSLLKRILCRATKPKKPHIE